MGESLSVATMKMAGWVKENDRKAEKHTKGFTAAISCGLNNAVFMVFNST